MKAIVIYYSYSGNTKNIALHIAEEQMRIQQSSIQSRLMKEITTPLWNRVTMKSEKDSDLL